MHAFPRLCVAAAALAALGCQRSRVAETLDHAMVDKTEDADMNFWHSLPGRSAVTNSEALHGVLLVVDGADPTVSWEDRLTLARDRGWVASGFDQPGDETVSRGTLAKAICHALAIEGGVMMRITDKAPRYALRELEFMRMMAESTENQVVTGLDYIGIMSRVQDYMTLQEIKAAGGAASRDADQPAVTTDEPPSES